MNLDREATNYLIEQQARSLTAHHIVNCTSGHYGDPDPSLTLAKTLSSLHFHDNWFVLSGDIVLSSSLVEIGIYWPDFTPEKAVELSRERGQGAGGLLEILVVRDIRGDFSDAQWKDIQLVALGFGVRFGASGYRIDFSG